ncbi:MAG: hypothetical protein NTW14_12515 [bacterium]|nr:hypothetical protein [bacterium]
MKKLTFILLGVAFCALTLHAEVSLTVYQRNIVLVRDLRTIDLNKGENLVKFDHIAPEIFEPTLRITPQGKFDDLKTIEQSYEYDLVDQDRVWKKYLGKPFQFTKDDSLFKGTLLNFDDDHIFFGPEEKPGAVSIISRSGIKDMTFDTLPEGLVTRPEVYWKVKAGKAYKSLKVEVAYLTDGITWLADYTAFFQKDNQIRLSGNLTMTNKLEMDFPDAKVDLIAGDVHRAYDTRTLGGEDTFEEAPAAAQKETATRFFEYRRYQVPDKVELHANQTKSIPLMGPVDVTCTKGFFYDGSTGDEKVWIRLLLDNTPATGLGMALPEGDLLLYQSDKDGSARFLGEDHLKASTPGDKVELVIGQAMDLRVDRKRVSHERISRNRTRDTVEITLSSSRENASGITVRERLYGFWEITEALWAGQSVTRRALDANKVEFDVSLPPGKSQTLRYVVEYGY